MNKVFLVGHTGSINRGCEAIVRSTIKLLKAEGIYEICLISDETKDDQKLNLDHICKIYATTKSKKYNPKKIIAKGLSKAFKIYMPEEKLRKAKSFNNISKGDIVMIIGGDTYCYNRPVSCYAANRLAKAHGAKTVLWGFSLEKKLITSEMIEDFKRYDLLCPREKITYDTLIEKGIEAEKIILMSDPAFSLEMNEVAYPGIMDEGKTIGINISPIVTRNEEGYKAVKELIEHIISQTDNNILLIPHVYDIKKVDWEVLNRLYNEYKYTNKVQMVSEYLSCTQLKTIISKCRMFIGARTHSTIAAYSTGVPTLVVGYSVKSRGIATDLFGTTENYALMYDELSFPKLLSAFEFIINNEQKIRNDLNAIMPDYRKQTIEAVRKIKAMGDFKHSRVLYTDKQNCSGCGACRSVCPNSCIEMIRDEDGFLYPHINKDNCIDCGMCEKVCHYKNQPDIQKTEKFFGAINKNDKTRNKSSSGGVFYELATEIIRRNGSVFGAGFDENFNVVHMQIEQEQDIKKLMGSKYVQSTIGDSYIKVKEILKSERWVLFSGTPCQINGLFKYLNGDYPRLITMDFICHGVPSPLAWRKYLDEMKKKMGSEIKNLTFRSKEYGWKTFSMKIEFESGKTYIKKLTEDEYLRSFLQDIHLRGSCYNCNAKGVDRASDITVADFWGLEKIKPEVNDDKGASILMVRSNKAYEIIDRIKENFTLFDIDEETVVKLNPSVVKSVAKNPLRKKFLDTVRKKSFFLAYEKYCSLKLGAKIHRKIGR